MARGWGVDLAGVKAIGAQTPRGAWDTMWVGGHGKVTIPCLAKDTRHGAPTFGCGRLISLDGGNRIDNAVSAGGAGRDGLDTRQSLPRVPSAAARAADFYPVLSEEYAAQIARDWNTKDERSGFEGYVLRFSVRTEFLRMYDVHVVGSSAHREYWIPADHLARLNENIVGEIEIVLEFRG